MSPLPTRPEIEAAVALPTYKVEVFEPTNRIWTLIGASSVIDVSGVIESTGNTENGLAFGSSIDPSVQIVVERPLVIASPDKLLEDTYFLLTPMRISYGFASSDYVSAFEGPIKDFTANGHELTITLTSNLEYVRNTKFHSDLFYATPVATLTAVASVEDPTNGSYQAGLINRILWEAGGRPYEQEGINYNESDADWRFWYSTEQSILTPDWSWISGENLIDELFQIARAGGGQIYQDDLGVVRYVQPFSFADLTPYGGLLYTPYEFEDDVFLGYTHRLTTYEKVGKVVSNFVPRTLQPTQVIYEDKSPRFFHAAEVKTVVLEMQWPIWEYETIDATSVSAILVDNHAVTPTVGSVTTSATKVSITITNPNATTPMVVNAIKISGRPLTAGESKTISYGSGDPERNVEDSPYIQSEPFATKLVRMIYDFYSTPREIVTLQGCIYDPDRFVGEPIKIQSSFNRTYLGGGSYMDNDDLYRIIAIRHSRTGTEMEIDAVNIEGLPTRDQFFIIGTTYSGANSRKLSY
jgi:hypothetical protein